MSLGLALAWGLGLGAWAWGLTGLAHTGHGTNQVHALPISPAFSWRPIRHHSGPPPAPCLTPTDAPGPPEGFYAPGLVSW